MCSAAAATTGFLVVLLSVPGVLGQWGWGVTCTSNQICALKGSMVDMSCTYKHPSRYRVNQRFWHRDETGDLRTTPDYTGRVEYSCERNRKSCTLRITDLRQSDTAKYQFRFTTTPKNAFSGTGVSLIVTGLAVQVHHTYSAYCNNKADVECRTSCKLPNNPTFIWYKNGEKIKEGRSPQTNYFEYDDGDGVVCAVKGHEALRSTPVYLGQRPCNYVTYTQKKICALKGSSVDISCTYTSCTQVVSKFWFSPRRGHQWENPPQPEDLRKDPRYEGRLQVLESQGGQSILRITQLRESDAAEYRFKFTTQGCEWKKDGTTVTVTDVQMLVTGTNVGPSQTWAELKCVSSCSPAGPISFIWVKNRQRSWKEIFLGWFSPGDEIYCALAGHETYRSSTLYAPVVPSVTPSVAPSDIIEGRSVTLTCAGNGATVKISWYKKDGNAAIRALGGEPQLVFESIKSSDSGEYQCRAESQLGSKSSDSIFVDVQYPPRPPSVSMVPSGDIVEGSPVNLTCSTDANPAANYSWFRGNQKLPETEHFYNFSSIRAEHKGTYHCKTENTLGTNSSFVIIDVLYPPRPPSVSMVPCGDDITVGSTVNLTCSSDANPAANYSWYKENERSPRASGHTFIITNFTADHSGDYYCEATNSRGSQRLSFSLPDVSETWIFIAAGTCAVSLALVVILLAVFVWIRWQKRQRPDQSEEVRKTGSRPSAAQQDDIHYASIHFSKRSEADAVYSNVGTARSQTRQPKQEDNVEYASVKFSAGSPAQRNTNPETGEDPSALYSTVNKSSASGENHR